MLHSLHRRSLLAAGLALTASACGPKGQTSASGLKDLKGRVLNLTPPVKALSIDDGRYLIALALIHPDPVSLLASWGHDVHRISPDIYQAFLTKFPDLAKVARTPTSAEDFSVEAMLDAQPQVAVLTLNSGANEAQLNQLKQAGVEVAFLDFFQKPFLNQPLSLSLLGRMIGREAEAEAYNQFRAARLKTIADRVAGLGPAQRPKVFLESHAGNGEACCNSVGNGNVGDYLTFVGGHNISADVLKQASGTVNLEYVIDQDPDIYIGTGGPHLDKVGGFVVGPTYSDARSKASLAKVVQRRGISTLKAVRQGRVHGLSHQLMNSPIDIVATEVLAKWIHPDLFADLDPAATLATINERYLAVQYQGQYWTDL